MGLLEGTVLKGLSPNPVSATLDQPGTGSNASFIYDLRLRLEEQVDVSGELIDVDPIRDLFGMNSHQVSEQSLEKIS